jgi:hydroxymethylpyrimidine pyrophosphatase-like HAD family hydrolase
VFGDHDNDIKMFQMADRGIAVANATEKLRRHATQVIGPNDEDSVVKFIREEVTRHHV